MRLVLRRRVRLRGAAEWLVGFDGSRELGSALDGASGDGGEVEVGRL